MGKYTNDGPFGQTYYKTYTNAKTGKTSQYQVTRSSLDGGGMTIMLIITGILIPPLGIFFLIYFGLAGGAAIGKKVKYNHDHKDEIENAKLQAELNQLKKEKYLRDSKDSMSQEISKLKQELGKEEKKSFQFTNVKDLQNQLNQKAKDLTKKLK